MAKTRKVFRCDGECDRILRLSLAHKVGLLQRSGSFKAILLCDDCYRNAGYRLKDRPIHPLGTTVTVGSNTYRYVPNVGADAKEGQLTFVGESDGQSKT